MAEKMVSQSKTYGYNGHASLITYRSLNIWLNYLMGVTILVFFLGTLTFGEKYSLREHAFSYFGMIKTPGGAPNTLCFLVFVMGGLMSAFICFRISHILQQSRSHWLFWLAGTGYLVLLVPCDLSNSFHMIGAALLFFSLWSFTVLHLVRMIPFTGRLKFMLYQLILQGSVLPYAVLYFIGSPEKQLFQKFAVFGLILALKMAAVEYERCLAHSVPTVKTEKNT
jgi:hypothetical protein